MEIKWLTPWLTGHRYRASKWQLAHGLYSSNILDFQHKCRLCPSYTYLYMVSGPWLTVEEKDGENGTWFCVCVCLLTEVSERGKGNEMRVGKQSMCKIPLRVKKCTEEMWGLCFLMPRAGRCLSPTTWLLRGELRRDSATIWSCEVKTILSGVISIVWSCGVFVTQGTPVIFGKGELCGWNFPG